MPAFGIAGFQILVQVFAGGKANPFYSIWQGYKLLRKNYSSRNITSLKAKNVMSAASSLETIEPDQPNHKTMRTTLDFFPMSGCKIRGLRI
jgi:hypothetical protein